MQLYVQLLRQLVFGRSLLILTQDRPRAASTLESAEPVQALYLQLKSVTVGKNRRLHDVFFRNKRSQMDC